MGLKITLIFTYVLITVVLFATFSTTIPVWTSFFVNALILLFITLYHIFEEKEYSPFLSSFIVFSFLFFLVAPIIQINSFKGINREFITLYPFIENEAVLTNTLICIFNVFFFLSYLFFKKVKFLTKVPEMSRTSKQLLPVTIFTIALLCLLIFLASLNFVQDEISRPAWKQSDFSNITLLLWKKVFFLVPLGGILLCFQYFRKEKKIAVNQITIGLLLVFFLALLFWFKNPLTEKRNALGPIYICLVFLFSPRVLNTNIKTLFFLFFSMIVLFPLTAILTHSDATFKEILKEPSILIEQMKGGGITNAFNTLNYDAFSNIMTTVDYTSVNGFAHGHQFLSAFLFFVPRGIWSEKPISTGQLVGEYLIDDYGFHFSNLSNPLVSEGYINFGIFGVILVAITLALVILKLMAWIKSDSFLKKIAAFYFGIHLIFLLRGDFANGFSYYIGTLIGMLMIPKIIEFFIKHILLYQDKWKRSKIARQVN